MPMPLASLSAVAVAVAAAISIAGAPTAPSTRETPFCAASIERPQDAVCAATEDALKAAWAASELSTDSTVLIVILYDNANMDGSAGSWSYYGSAACTSTTSDIDYSVSTLGSFNQRTSSFQSYNNCATRLWSGTSFTGTAFPGSTSFQVSSTNVGASFNDKAQSAQFS